VTGLRQWVQCEPWQVDPTSVGREGKVRAMSSQETDGQKHADRRTEETEEAPVENTDVTERHEALSEDVDAILDEIDEVLEENAEEFVRAFVQKGGE